MFKKVWKEFFALLMIVALTESAFAQGGSITIRGTYNGTTVKNIAVDSNGNLVLSGTITGGNGAASNTGSGVPAQAGYTGVNIGGTLTGVTGTAVSSSRAMDVNIVGGATGGGAVTVASGAVASGAYAAGSIAAGAIVDGADLTQGAIGDAAATQGSTGSISAKLRTITSQLNTLNSLAATDPCAGTIPTIKRYISVGSSEDESQVKATAGTLCAIQARNANSSADAFLKCTNLTAANTTPGSSAVYYDMIVPKGGGYVNAIIHAPFSVALTCYIVTGKADSDATEVAADDVSYFLLYQ